MADVIQIPYAPRLWAKKLHASYARWAALVLHRRGGKAQPLTAKVLTPDGFVPMGEVLVGTVVVTPSGRPARVIGVFPQGVQQTYRVTLADGSSTCATGDHLWKVSFANRRRRDRVVSTDYLRGFLDRESGRKRKNRSRPLLDMIGPDVDFGASSLPLEPYLLGALLGDGGLSDTSGVRFSSVDPAMEQAFQAAGIRIEPVSKSKCDYHIYGLNEVIKALGLRGTKSSTKFIPAVYQTARRADRLALIQGLLDTDGSAGRNRIEYCSVSLRLARDVASLCRGLGWYAHVRDGGLPTFTYLGEKKFGQRRYRLHIRVPQGQPPFRLTRKADRYTGYRWESSRHAIVSIEPETVEACQCIAVDDPDQLYVTDDFIVTHNTTAILNHHQRAAMDDTWELARLRTLLPDASAAFLQPLLKRRIYWHVMPSLKQAKLVAWDMLKDFASPIPGVKINNSDLEVTYPTGNKLRLIGADDPDSLRGPALSGLSLDEYSQIPAKAFGEVLSKALGDHLGYCIFSGTIKGKDQLYRAYEAAKDDPDWYAVWQDIDVSLATEAGPTLTALKRAMEDDLRLVLQGVMTRDEFDQEWYLSADAAIQGAFYAKEMAAAKSEGRITRVPVDGTIPVDTDWDLGMDDSTAIWFSQSLRSGEIRLVDYYEASGEGLPHYVKILSERGYVYGKHYPPHDIAVRELGTGKSRKETAASLGLTFADPPGALSLVDGIDATRLVLARCWFDEIKTAKGIEALRQYRKAFNVRMQEFTGTPIHNVFSHGADALRGLAVRHQLPREHRAEALRRRPPLTGPQSWLGG